MAQKKMAYSIVVMGALLVVATVGRAVFFQKSEPKRVASQSVPVFEGTGKGPQLVSKSIENGIELDGTPILDIYEEKSFPYYTFRFKDDFFDIYADNYTGEAEFILENGNRVRFIAEYDDEANPSMKIRVNEKQIYLPNTYIGEFFSYTFIFPNTTEFYAFDGGGHEGIPVHYYSDGRFLTNYNDVMQAVLKDEFSMDYVFPQFSIYVTPSYLKLIEERYCCDVLFNLDDPDRKNFRKFFIFNRANLDIIEKGKFAR